MTKAINVTSHYDKVTDTMTVTLVNTKKGQPADDEYAAAFPKAGVDTQIDVTYRYFVTSNTPSSAVIANYEANWDSRRDYLAAALSVFFADSVGFMLPANNNMIVASDVNKASISALFKQALHLA